MPCTGTHHTWLYCIEYHYRRWPTLTVGRVTPEPLHHKRPPVTLLCLQCTFLPLIKLHSSFLNLLALSKNSMFYIRELLLSSETFCWIITINLPMRSLGSMPPHRSEQPFLTPCLGKAYQSYGWSKSMYRAESQIVKASIFKFL